MSFRGTFYSIPSLPCLSVLPLSPHQCPSLPSSLLQGSSNAPVIVLATTSLLLRHGAGRKNPETVKEIKKEREERDKRDKKYNSRCTEHEANGSWQRDCLSLCLCLCPSAGTRPVGRGMVGVSSSSAACWTARYITCLPHALVPGPAVSLGERDSSLTKVARSPAPFSGSCIMIGPASHSSSSRTRRPCSQPTSHLTHVPRTTCVTVQFLSV